MAISNKVTFTEPVYNYSAPFEFIWEELTFPMAHSPDWHRAEAILAEEGRRVSAGREAREAIDEMVKRYPVPLAEMEPKVYARATDDYVEPALRFVVPVRPARSTKDEMTRRILERFPSAGIEVASTSLDVDLRTDRQ